MKTLSKNNEELPRVFHRGKGVVHGSEEWIKNHEKEVKAARDSGLSW